MRCYRVVDKIPTAVSHEQAIEQLEANGRHDEQVRRSNPIAWLRRKVAHVWTDRLGRLAEPEPTP
jgi:hypothetical protein